MNFPQLISIESRKTARQTLKRGVAFSILGLAIIAVTTIPLDYGHYGKAFQEWGLVGFLSLPSLLAIQSGILISIFCFFVFAFRQGAVEGLKVRAWLVGIGLTVYCLSIFLIYGASQHGEFGIGAVAVVALFGYFPSVVFILISFPATVLHTLKKLRN